MKIAVIAANGRLGKAFVEAALSEGHTVHAGIRGQDNLAPNDRLTTLLCDATNPLDLKRLIEGQDAVVSCIGHVKNSAPNVQTVATKVLIDVMEKLAVKRFVTVTGTGVRFPGDSIGLVDRFLNIAVGMIDPDRVKDGQDHTRLLQASQLDWTLIRVLKLLNVQSHSFQLTLHGPTKWYVGRQEVASAMLQVLTQHSFIQKSPIISRKKTSSPRSV